MPDSKVCNQCNAKKSISEFYRAPSNRDGYQNRCKDCKKAYAREYGVSARGIEVRKARTARVYKEKRHAIKLWQYGLTHEDYIRMLTEQDGKCAICQQPERAALNGKIKALCVDHDHQTGEVRRLLCLGCNVKLGWLENNLAAVRDYLKI